MILRLCPTDLPGRHGIGMPQATIGIALTVAKDAFQVGEYSRFVRFFRQENTRAFLGTPLRLRGDIPRTSATPGLNGTTRMGCGTSNHAQNRGINPEECP